MSPEHRERRQVAAAFAGVGIMAVLVVLIVMAVALVVGSWAQ